MPDTPFKSMSREKPEEPHDATCNKFTVCERCYGFVHEGDWPWCKNGDPQTHRRD